VLIAQISDTHVTDPGELLAGRIDSSAQLARMVAQIRSLETRPDCLLASGDLTDRGTVQAYSELRRLLAPLALPIYAIPGNHDRREPMRDAFADCAWMPRQRGSRLCYQIALGALTLIALDTLVDGEDYGMLGAGQLDWLQSRLDATSGLPTIVMLHHPPVNSGLAVMDAMKLKDAAALGDLVSHYSHVERIVCGHLHRAMHARWRGTVVSVPSSPVEQLRLAFDPHAPLATLREPPGFLLHYWDAQDGLISHHVPVGDFPGPFFY
jgi:3',5'-cyclic AMP phosphodiesterase CpdA